MVKHCPDCQSEYRDEATVCPDCDASLLEGPPGEPALPGRGGGFCPECLLELELGEPECPSCQCPPRHEEKEALAYAVRLMVDWHLSRRRLRLAPPSPPGEGDEPAGYCPDCLVEYRPDVEACAECGVSLQPCVAGALSAAPPATDDLEAALSGPSPQFHPLLLSPDLEEDPVTANRRRLAWDTAREIATVTCHECREPVEPDPTAIDLWRCTGCGLTFTGEVHGIVL